MVDGQFWTFVEAGLERIQTPELLTVLRQLRAEVSACLVEHGSAALLGAGPDLDEASLGRIVEGLAFLDADVRQALDAGYARIAPLTLQRVAAYVRAHPEAFPWGSGPRVRPQWLPGRAEANQSPTDQRTTASRLSSSRPRSIMRWKPFWGSGLAS